ncbi:MAG: DUF1259 domain-containing protein [Chitinophagaceae bacterium]
MKKVIFYLFTSGFLILSACNGQRDQNQGNDQDSDQVQAAVQAPIASPAFQKITLLPAGIDTIFGKSPSKEMGFYKFSFPRTDLQIKWKGITLDPRLALTSWFSLMPVTGQQNVMLMGDLALLETELPAVEKKLEQEGIDITAIHNHLLEESPKVMFLHVSAMGDPVALSEKMKIALTLTKTPFKPVFHDLGKMPDWTKVEKRMGAKGMAAGPVISFGIPRNEQITENGMLLPPGFGVATGIGFQQVGNQAIITGDFVLMAAEVNPVAKTLMENGITVTAIHNHMLNDHPHLFMMHFLAMGNPEVLASEIYMALAKTNSKK